MNTNIVIFLIQKNVPKEIIYNICTYLPPRRKKLITPWYVTGYYETSFFLEKTIILSCLHVLKCFVVMYENLCYITSLTIIWLIELHVYSTHVSRNQTIYLQLVIFLFCLDS